MSSMLEEAIVDAAALKEAAIKNAENVIVERYSDDIREAVETLLEGELEGDEPEEEAITSTTSPSGSSNARRQEKKRWSSVWMTSRTSLMLSKRKKRRNR